MNVTVTPQLSSVPNDAPLAVPIVEGENSSDLTELSQGQRDRLDDLTRIGAKAGRSLEITLLVGEHGERTVVVVGTGKKADLAPLVLKQALGAATRYLTGLGYQSIALSDRGWLDAERYAEAAVEGAIEGAYNIGIKKTGPHTERKLESIAVVSNRGKPAEEGARLGQIVGESRDIARGLVNRPPNEITPTTLAQHAEDLAHKYGLHFESLDENDMQQLGMGSLLGVAAGSHEPPRAIILRYEEGNATKRVAFAGKGITFDSGGLSLKTAEGMETMKSDMSGAAAVIAGMVAVARLAPKDIRVTGYVGATENMPGGGAMRPGDVLTAMNGKTIEVLNTDAEGRLVLADILSYAVKQGETHIVDFATLTGAAVMSLGHAATLATGKPMTWVDEVVKSADAGLERAWPMPLYRDYRQAMDSEIADVKNTGGRAAGAGALTAAAFLSEFAEGAEWAHMDIAGTAFAREKAAYRASGATGVGVGTVVNVTRAMAG